jgi:hypothetical protein
MLSARRDVGMLRPTVWLLKRAHVSAKHLTWRIVEVDVTVAGVIRTTLSNGAVESYLVASLIEYLNSVNACILSTTNSFLTMDPTAFPYEAYLLRQVQAMTLFHAHAPAYNNSNKS